MEQVRFGLHFLQLIKFKKTRAQNEALLLLEKLAWQGLQPKKNKKLKSAMRNLPILVCASFVRVEDHDSKGSKVDRSRSHIDLPKSKETMVPDGGFRVIVASMCCKMFLGYSSSNETWNKSKCQPLNTAKILHSSSATIMRIACNVHTTGENEKNLGKENLRHQVASIGRRCGGVAGAEVDGLEGL